MTIEMTEKLTQIETRLGQIERELASMFQRMQTVSEIRSREAREAYETLKAIDASLYSLKAIDQSMQVLINTVARGAVNDST
jgi:hypothetical protein